MYSSFAFNSPQHFLMTGRFFQPFSHLAANILMTFYANHRPYDVNIWFAQLNYAK